MHLYRSSLKMPIWICDHGVTLTDLTNQNASINVILVQGSTNTWIKLHSHAKILQEYFIEYVFLKSTLLDMYF